MAKRSRPLRVRYHLEAEQYRSGQRSLDEANTTSSTAFTPSGSCLMDNTTLLSAMCDVVEREATQLPTPAAPTEEPRSCYFVVINFLCMFITVVSEITYCFFQLRLSIAT